MGQQAPPGDAGIAICSTSRATGWPSGPNSVGYAHVIEGTASAGIRATYPEQDVEVANRSRTVLDAHDHLRPSARVHAAAPPVVPLARLFVRPA
jgi:hypothetical protein